jgi:hypothetical protein
MKLNYKLLGIISFCAAAFGFVMATLIINSENGYVGSMVFFPVFLLAIIVGFVLFSISIIVFSFDKKSLSASLLISAFLLPASFIAFCLIAKYFEIGAYRREPMIPFPISINTIVSKESES